MPDIDVIVSVYVYCVDAGDYIGAGASLSGGGVYNFEVPAWNRWYRIDFGELGDGGSTLGQSIRKS